jgi:hypothetical protein
MVASTNHLDQLDPGLSSRPSRFDRKYLFPLPSMEERVLYCEYWRSKLASKPSIKFPKKLCAAIAGITKDFSFAYLKEAFVATLLTIAGHRSEDEVRGAGDDEGSDLDDYELWREIKKQVKQLRDDMDTRSQWSRNRLKCVEDLSYKEHDRNKEATVTSTATATSQMPSRKQEDGYGMAKKQQNPRLGGRVVDCDARQVPLMTDEGKFLDSKFGGVGGMDVL